MDGYSRFSNGVSFGQSPIFLVGTENISADSGTDGRGRNIELGLYSEENRRIEKRKSAESTSVKPGASSFENKTSIT
ncbi:MAG: hypothetical protein IJN44_00755 [Clostridia bacterium]|nr:hypothetical protein [Clostridia bacterium]